MKIRILICIVCFICYSYFSCTLYGGDFILSGKYFGSVELKQHLEFDSSILKQATPEMRENMKKIPKDQKIISKFELTVNPFNKESNSWKIDCVFSGQDGNKKSSSELKIANGNFVISQSKNILFDALQIAVISVVPSNLKIDVPFVKSFKPFPNKIVPENARIDIFNLNKQNKNNLYNFLGEKSFDMASLLPKGMEDKMKKSQYISKVMVAGEIYEINKDIKFSLVNYHSLQVSPMNRVESTVKLKLVK